MTGKATKELIVDHLYDLPYAIAYGKITWFLWHPIDQSHRRWVNIVSGLEVKQGMRGGPVRILRQGTGNGMKKQLGLWFEPNHMIKQLPDMLRMLYELYPMRMPWVSEQRYFSVLLAAAVLSPQVSWEVNSRWVRVLRNLFRNKIERVANYEPSEIEELIKSRCPEVRRLGYHSRVLVRAFQDLTDKFHGSKELLKMEVADARKALLGIYGVGPKVAMFLVQATHGDLAAACVDRHVFRNALNLQLVSADAEPYFPNWCQRYINNCNRCPFMLRCAAGQLMTRFEVATIVSSLLYYPMAWAPA
ncbi:MAG: endonuclease III domain-containing protein [archaeon]|nr:endonuclease III domain-containing protein [archaeon]